MEINEFCSEIKKQLVKKCEKEFGVDFDEVLIQPICKLNLEFMHTEDYDDSAAIAKILNSFCYLVGEEEESNEK